MKSISQNICLSILFIGVVGCTEPGQSTTVGAATGGVIGAGLGAIVGNQVGNPGAGLVTGAAAGATAGGAVGNALDQQDQKIASQAEISNRHDEMLRSQRAEIAALKRVDQDSSARSSFRGFAKGSTKYSDEDTSIGGFRPVRYATEAEIKAAREKLGLKHEQKHEAPARKSAKVEKRKAAPVHEVVSVKEVNSPKKVEVEKTKAHEAPVVVEHHAPIIEHHGSVKEEHAAEPVKHEEEHMPVKEAAHENKIIHDEKDLHEQEEPAAPEASEVQDTTAKLLPDADSNDSECGAAQGEVEKAHRASDSADKLFHLRRALRMCPDNAQYHAELSKVYGTLGRKEDADYEKQEALKLNPKIVVESGAASNKEHY